MKYKSIPGVSESKKLSTTPSRYPQIHPYAPRPSGPSSFLRNYYFLLHLLHEIVGKRICKENEEKKDQNTSSTKIDECVSVDIFFLPLILPRRNKSTNKHILKQTTNLNRLG